MSCYYHPDRESVETCAECAKQICAECKVTLAGRVYCNPCAENLFQEKAVALEKTRNWFERHLNWTVVLSLLSAYVLAFVIGLIVGVIMYGSNPDAVQTEVDSIVLILTFAVVLAWLLFTNGWVLRKKGQSEWHLVWLLVPLGFLVILALENRNRWPGSSARMSG